jgi:predicted amidohydrolase
MEAVELIRKRVEGCEAEGVEILCCPEAVLGGLADYAACPADFALDVESGQLSAVLAPLASDMVTTILGFTEISGEGQLYNSAAVFHQGAVIGLYRKLNPAIRKSVYQAGDQIPVFRIRGLTFGIILCNDSNDPEPARIMASQGATALFVPTNNGLPPERADVVVDAWNADIARATENSVTIIRADVAGRAAGLVSYGSSGIVDPEGTILQSARRLTEDLLVTDLDTAPRRRRAVFLDSV